MVCHSSQKTKSAYPDTFTLRVYALFVCAFFLLIPTFAHAEQIDSFVSDIEVRKDATLKVKETITYKFDDQRHGIFRCIPTKHQDKASSLLKDRYIDIEIGEVRMDAGSVPFEITKDSAQVCVKIGDPNSTVSGVHTYELSYTVGGAVSYETYGGADLYWNVTGNEWEVPILSVDARVTSPDQIFMTERSCYRGVVGKADSCKMTTDESGTIHFGGTLFNPKEGLTLAQGLNRSKIPIDIRERYKSLIIGIVITILSILMLSYVVYRYNTRFKTGNTIIPQYEPYPGVKPMYMGALFDGKLDPRDITAGIVYLAEQGIIKIKKIEKKVLFFFEVDDYEISLLQPLEKIVDVFDHRILKLLFKNDSSIGDKITLGTLKGSSSRMRKNASQLRGLKKALLKNLKDEGFFVKSSIGVLYGTYVTLLGVIAMFFFIGLIESFQPDGFHFVSLGILLCGYLIFSVLLGDQRTQKGYEALDHLRGFKEFLQVTEKDRYIFHNAPEKSPEQFMEYLPYAIAFGVEKEWAKTFEGITMQNPNWYDGGSDAHAFSAIALTDSLGGFSSFVTNSVSSPGGSASGGGGFSGGGGGGGGGGSW